LRCLLYPLPGRTVVPGKLLKAEAAFEPGSDVERDQRGLERDRATAAHRVEERRAGPPTRQPQQAGGEILAQGGFRIGAPQAPLEQRLAGGVEIERRLRVGKIGIDANVGPILADARAAPADRAMAIADGIL